MHTFHTSFVQPKFVLISVFYISTPIVFVIHATDTDCHTPFFAYFK